MVSRACAALRLSMYCVASAWKGNVSNTPVNVSGQLSRKKCCTFCDDCIVSLIGCESDIGLKCAADMRVATLTLARTNDKYEDDGCVVL
jgi:hypothetical protein